MNMQERITRSAVVLVAAVTIGFSAATAQQGARPMTKADKIANAMSAAPRALSSQATISDWPASQDAEPTVLRSGTNGWVCFPDYPETPGNDPMCLDQPWQAFLDAMMTQSTPHITSIGVSYMLAPGGASGSNTDPYATAATPDNEWGHDGPHLMIVLPDTTAFRGLPTTRQQGAPFVMWAGTPYVHIMVPMGGDSGGMGH